MVLRPCGCGCERCARRSLGMPWEGVGADVVRSLAGECVDLRSEGISRRGRLVAEVADVRQIAKVCAYLKVEVAARRECLIAVMTGGAISRPCGWCRGAWQGLLRGGCVYRWHASRPVTSWANQAAVICVCPRRLRADVMAVDLRTKACGRRLSQCEQPDPDVGGMLVCNPFRT